MPSANVSRKELIGAKCAECERLLTTAEIDAAIASELFHCSDCGSMDYLLTNGDRIATRPD